MNMKTATVREAQHDLSKLVEELSDGEEIILTRRGKKVGRLSPYREPSERKVTFPDFAKLREEIGTAEITGENEVLRQRDASL